MGRELSNNYCNNERQILSKKNMRNSENRVLKKKKAAPEMP